MMVCNLAEAAAEAVNADPLLTRIGAYYHDIGKLKRPYFFTENQLSGQNPHDKLSPNLSAMIIRLHVKDGVELARKHRLPAAIEDIIRQHHGTGLILYFYQKALENCGEGTRFPLKNSKATAANKGGGDHRNWPIPSRQDPLAFQSAGNRVRLDPAHYQGEAERQPDG